MVCGLYRSLQQNPLTPPHGRTQEEIPSLGKSKTSEKKMEKGLATCVVRKLSPGKHGIWFTGMGNEERRSHHRKARRIQHHSSAQHHGETGKI